MFVPQGPAKTIATLGYSGARQTHMIDGINLDEGSKAIKASYKGVHLTI